MAEDLVALGFSFSAGNADSEIQKFIDKLDELNTASDSAKQKLGKLFDSSFISRVDHATRLVGKFNSALQHTAGFAKNTCTQLRPLSEAFNRVNPAAIKPISPAVLDSVVKLTAEIEKAAAAASKLKFSKARINSGAVTELATESRSAAGAVDSLADTFSRRFQEGAALAYFQQATQQAIAFGEELAYIKTLALNFDISKVRSGLLNLSSELGPVRENATALYYAYSSGVEGTEADLVKFTAAMAKTAKVIRAKVLPTIDAATSAMNAYNVSSKEAVKIMPDLFFSIVKYGKASGEQLATGLGQVIATSATAGLTLDEMGASITSLTKTMQTRNAITYFNNMLSKLIKPSKGAMQAARALGIELGLDALRAKGFSNMMQELRDKTKDSQEALLRIFPDLRGQRAALQLLNKGWGDFQYQLQNFANKAGAADEAMRQLSADTNYQLSVLPVTFSKIRQGAGELIVNLITLGGTLTPVIAAFNNMGETGQAVAGAMTLMVGGYAILKGGMFVHRTAQAIEIRNNEILSAQRQKEIGERKAVAASVTAEAAARARAASTPLTAAAGGNSATANKAAVTAAAAYYARVNAAKQAAAATQAENAASIRNLAVETQRAAAAKAVAAAKAEEANASYQSVAASVEKARAGAAEAAAKTRSVATRAGIVSVDEILSELNVSSLNRLFPVDTRNEERTRAAGLHRWYELQFDTEVDLDLAAQKLSAVAEVANIQFNTKLEKMWDGKATPLRSDAPAMSAGTRSIVWPFNDPELKRQWHYINKGDKAVAQTAREGADINVEEAWKLTAGDPKIIVAVVDEGVKYTHPDLAANMWVNTREMTGTTGVDDDGNGYVDDYYGYNFVTNGPISWDVVDAKGDGDSGHGTHTAGTVAAVNNNGIGVCGVAGGSGNNDGVRIMSCQALSGTAAGSGTTAVMARAFKYAADNGASIIQCSMGIKGGGYTSDDQYAKNAKAEHDALAYFIATSNCDAIDGGLVIFSAGNDALDRAGYPGAFRDYISVTSFSPDFLPASYTNYGPGCNISAPGGDAYIASNSTATVLSTMPSEMNEGSDYGYMQGTSMACPHMSGVAALGLSYALKQGKHYTRNEFISMLLTSVNDMERYLDGTKESNGTMYLENYRKQLGTGAVDAYQLLMQIEGTPCLKVGVGAEELVPLTQFFGGSATNLTYTGVSMSAADMAKLGIETLPTMAYGKLKIKCTKSGVAKITVTAIGGGDKVGTGTVMGGMTITKEFAIIARGVQAGNGGWL